jgi:hypothetical protein
MHLNRWTPDDESPFVVLIVIVRATLVGVGAASVLLRLSRRQPAIAPASFLALGSIREDEILRCRCGIRIRPYAPSLDHCPRVYSPAGACFRYLRESAINRGVFKPRATITANVATRGFIMTPTEADCAPNHPTLNWHLCERTGARLTISDAIGSVKLREVGSVAWSTSVY